MAPEVLAVLVAPADRAVLTAAWAVAPEAWEAAIPVEAPAAVALAAWEAAALADLADVVAAALPADSVDAAVIAAESVDARGAKVATFRPSAIA